MQKESYGPAWDQVIARLLSEPDDSTVHVDDHLVDLPRQSGMTWMPLPSDDGQPVYGGFLDATSGFVVHHVGTAYQVKRHSFGAAPSTTNVARSATATPKAPSAPPRSASRSGESPVTVEVVEARRVHRREADPDTLSPQMNAALVAGMTIAGAALGAAFDGSRGAVAGAMIGGGAGLAAVAISTASSSPETAAVAQTLFAGLAHAGASVSKGGRLVKVTPVVPFPQLRGQESEDQPHAISTRRRSRR